MDRRKRSDKDDHKLRNRETQGKNTPRCETHGVFLAKKMFIGK